MESSFVSPGGVSSPFSPKVSQAVTGKRTSLLSSFRNQSKLNSSARSSQVAQTVLKTSLNTVESFGVPLPVLVTETLTFADSSACISSRLSVCGWAWVVCGRRLLVWQYRPSPATPPVPPTCYELTLPQTDLAHSADLVCVYTAGDAQVPSCMGVSPEGVVRYWPLVSHEGGYWEDTADLHGQESDKLLHTHTHAHTLTQPCTCVLATTTCTLLLLTVHNNTHTGRYSVLSRTLRDSAGWLGGLSRRVSSLFFSAMPSAHPHETKLVGVVCVGESLVCMVAGLGLQLWQLGGGEGLLLEAELQPLLSQAHGSTGGDASCLEVSVLDIQPWSSGVLLLTSATNTARASPARYAIVHMSTCCSDGSAGQLISVLPLQPSLPLPTSGVRLLATPTHAFIYTHANIIVQSMSGSEKADLVELAPLGEQLLGAGLYSGVAVFFSRQHGVISVMPNDSSAADNVLSGAALQAEGQLSLYSLDPLAVGVGGQSPQELLKAAFLHHVGRQHSASRRLLQETFPQEAPRVDALLDRTVLAIATDLINDVPNSDPRWSQAGRGGGGAALGSSGSLQIALQLQDKRRALSLLLDFLRASGLWARLGGAREAGGGAGGAPTVLLLRGLQERLLAATCLRNLQQQPQHQHLIDNIIQQVVSSREEEELLQCGALSPSDLFYKSVSSVGEALVRAAQWALEQDAAAVSLTQLITKLNTILITVMQDVVRQRQQQAEQFAVSSSAASLRLGQVTWTSCEGPRSLQQALRELQRLAVQRARAAGPSDRGALYAQAGSLASLSLSLAQEACEGDADTAEAARKHYANIRTSMIQPLVDDEEYDLSLELAEKFLDFDLLVSICEKSQQREKLHQLMNKLHNMGFCESAFSWLVSAGGAGRASLLRGFPQHSGLLSKWLAAPGGEQEQLRQQLLWLQQLREQRWLQAAQQLHSLAQQETDSVDRMTVQSSLSKLCALAAEADSGEAASAQLEVLQGSGRQLLLSSHHLLPAALLAGHGLQQDSLRVMEPAEIVDMYISYEGRGLTEYDYMRALELCELVEGEGEEEQGVGELRRRIWCATILRDQWQDFHMDAPLDTVQEKMFFKVVMAVNLLDCELCEYLCPLKELLLSPELQELGEDTNFLYIMKAGYEHLYPTHNQ